MWKTSTEQDGAVSSLGTVEVFPSGEVESSSGVTYVSAGLAEEAATSQPAGGIASRLQAAWKSFALALPAVLLALSLLLYLSTHLIGLTRFPIYFFTDEAAQTVLAADLVRDGFKNYAHELLPAFFENGGNYRLGLSVYAQVLPYLMFGKSVFVTRATAALLTLIAAVSIALILRQVFKSVYWWSGVLFLAITPAWFLHSRTAFEVTLGVSFYALFLYLYLLYRYRSPKYLYLALLAAGLAFYSFSTFQFVVPVTGLLLAISDWRYHWQNRRTILLGLLLIAVILLPYLRFNLAHRLANEESLASLGSYLTQPLPVQEKARRFVLEYLRGFNPTYWFIPHIDSLPRHIMKGYANLTRLTLPFILLGLGLAVWRSRPREPLASAYRAVLITLLVAPLGGALAEVGITRLLVIVIPVVLLTVIGLEAVLLWVERFHLPRQAIQVTLFIVLALANLIMLRDSLVNGPTWFQEYGMGGMQYGATQVFQAVKDYKAENPRAKIIFSPTWANGTDVLARFFLSDPLPIQMGSIEGHLFEVLPLDDQTVFVMTPDEYKLAVDSGKFTDIRVDKVLPYPNAEPGFYFVRLKYIPNIAAVLAGEEEARRALQETQVTVGNETWTVQYSPLDISDIGAVLDGDPNSFVRTIEANPMVLDLQFPEVKELKGLELNIGSVDDMEVTASMVAAPGEEPVTYTAEFQSTVENPKIELDFDVPVRTLRLHLELRDANQSEPGHVHLWEMVLK